MECPICYENITDAGDMIRLDCLHSLCRRCLRKLEVLRCPYCRTEISLLIFDFLKKSLPSRRYLAFADNIHVRTRRRHRMRRRTHELNSSDMGISNMDSRIMIEESLQIPNFREIKKRRKQKSGCDKKRQKYRQAKKGKWTGMNRQTFGRQRNHSR